MPSGSHVTVIDRYASVVRVLQCGNLGRHSSRTAGVANGREENRSFRTTGRRAVVQAAKRRLADISAGAPTAAGRRSVVVVVAVVCSKYCDTTPVAHS